MTQLPSREASGFDFNIHGLGSPRKHLRVKCFGQHPLRDHKERLEARSTDASPNDHVLCHTVQDQERSLLGAAISSECAGAAVACSSSAVSILDKPAAAPAATIFNASVAALPSNPSVPQLRNAQH